MLIRVYDAAADLQALCLRERWRFCFIGGLAVLRWSEPRMTDDADITLFTDFGGEEEFVDVLLKRFRGRVPNAREFALRARVLLLQHENSVPLDVGLGALPFERRSIERSSLWHATEGCELRTCCAEDLIVHKAFASRDQDWVDIDGIVRRQGEKLETNLIFEELEPLAALKEQPEILDRLRALMNKRLRLS
ncbi:MAG TPA: nucleotidyl transferase AbiEii/AbiGii toxin family protein [Chthoniobacterales bacterium]|nr:nucleotidyl transferase AbiEii/AbiGii toxin family protein [Chthoniobacterales bacterium]